MIAGKHIEILVLILASTAAIYVGSHVVQVSVPMMAILMAGLLTVLWAFVAGRYWWLPVLPGALIAGVFRIGFKVYPTEIALALSILGLIPVIFIQDRTAFQGHRRPLPFIFYLTAAYVLIRISIDILPVHGPERLNMVRVLFGAFWPFIFAFLFHNYGNLSIARLALKTTFVVLLIRTFFSGLGYLTGIPLVIPGINYVLSFSDVDSLTAMRTVALMLVMIACIFFHASKSALARTSLVGVMIFCVLLVIMGASRFSTLMVLVLPVAFFAWSRHWILLMLAAFAGFAGVATINIFPHIIDPLPGVAERSLSGLIIGNAEGLHEATGSSDLWHHDLRVEGYDRWSQTPLTMMFGYGIRPSPDLFEAESYSEDPKEVLRIAANVSSYECALWAVLAVLGVVGYALYLLLFLHFWKRTFPYFFRRPEGTFWEGLLFWGCYLSIVWLVTAYFQGTFPGLEIILLVVAADLIEEGKLAKLKTSPAPHSLAPLSSALPLRLARTPGK